MSTALRNEIEESKKDYQNYLMALLTYKEEIENFIEESKHFPEVPNAVYQLANETIKEVYMWVAFIEKSYSGIEVPAGLKLASRENNVSKGGTNG